MQEDHLLYILFNKYNTILPCVKKHVVAFGLLHVVFFPPSVIMLNTWIAGVNQGEENSNIPLGLKPTSCAPFFSLGLGFWLTQALPAGFVCLRCWSRSESCH